MNELAMFRDGHIRRRELLQMAALAAAGPATLAAAGTPTRAAQPTEMFAYVGAFTTAQRKGHGDGINVYRMDPRTGVWAHVQLVPNIVTIVLGPRP